MISKTKWTGSTDAIYQCAACGARMAVGAGDEWSKVPTRCMRCKSAELHCVLEGAEPMEEYECLVCEGSFYPMGDTPTCCPYGCNGALKETDQKELA